MFVTTNAVARTETFDLLVDGKARGADDLQANTLRIVEAAEEQGLAVDDIAAAWSYPVADAGLPLRSAVEQDEPATGLSWARVRRLDADDELPVYTFAAADGFITTNSFLVDDTDLRLDESGAALPSGEDHEAYIWVSVPTSVADAPERTVPVLLFGHGIFGHPRGYLDTDDTQQVQRLADELGAIVVALTWHGMASADRVDVLGVGSDFGRLPTVPGRMVQGHAAWASVIRAIQEDDLLADEALLGASGQVLADPETLVYYGISLGGIEGQILQSQHPEIEHAVFHVPGGMWSSLLERSSQWLPFDIVIGDSLPESADRQVLYAGSQLWWDMVDPATFNAELAERSFILQESTGDEQVANFTTRTLARTAEVPVLLPSADDPWGLAGVEPSAALTQALVQFDPDMGIPVDSNRPAANSGAHSEPRTWPGTRQQAVHMLKTGEIAHFCGTEVCSASNPGADPEPQR